MGINSGLAPLIARPPTPPKESTNKLANGNDSVPSSFEASHFQLDTPDESPSSADYFKNSSGKAQKKVTIAIAKTKFHRLPPHGSKDSDSEGSVRRLPPSKECRSRKSILKFSSEKPSSQHENELVAFDQTSLTAMLRSTIQHLTNTSRTSRLDAYTTLVACLSAYEDEPEMTDLSEKVVEIVNHIRRDIVAKTDLNGPPDTQLIAQALKVLTILLCTRNTASLLPEEFCSFILDRSISTLEDTDSPKILVSHYMHLLEKQRFSTRLMTIERVGRLLTALDMVTLRVKGNRVVCHRLMIYRRFLVQAKSVMAARVGTWIDHLISGMLSSLKDVRVRAIGFGVEAGLQLGTISSVSQSCTEVLNRASPEGKKVIDFLSARLLEMVGSKEDGVHVPQIWSTIILFLRCRRRQLESWEHIKSWLVIIQRCLNSSDPQVKFQAHIAWSRLIFVINLDTSTSISMAKMLRQPMMSQIERKASDKSSKQAKQIARSTYCSLLYYAFRPEAAYSQLDLYWGLYVAQILPSSFTTTKSDVNHACDILAALLLPNLRPKLWDENRANTNGPVKLDELPCLDPKWVRSRADNVIQVFEKLLNLAEWQTNNDCEPPIILAWQSFMTALGAAGSKEVKVSMETMKTVSQIINLLKRLLEKVNQPFHENSDRRRELDHGDPKEPFIEFRCLTLAAVAQIGSIPFLERRIVLTSHDRFEAAETPSSRLIKDPSSLGSPTTHLLNLLLMHKQTEQPHSAYIDAMRTLIQIPLQSATTRRSQLSALRSLARLLFVENAFDRYASVTFWQLLAEAACSSLRLSHQNDSHNSSPHSPGHEFQDALKILELGLRQRSPKVTPAWLELYKCISTSLRQDIGDDGLTIIINEPLAEVIGGYSGSIDEALLANATTLLNNAHWPQSLQSMDRARRLLLGGIHTSQKTKFDDPFAKLLNMTDLILGSVYRHLTTLSVESTISLLSSVTAVIRSCPSEYGKSMLSRTQLGLGTWIEDSDEQLKPSTSSSLIDSVSIKVDNLWTEVLSTIENMPDHNTAALFNVQHVVLSGFKSRSQSIMNQSITMWNRTFGRAEALEYPEEIRKVLLILRSMTEMQLPSLQEAETDQAMLSLTHFINQYNETSEMQRPLPAKSPIRNMREKSVQTRSNIPGTLTLSPSPKFDRNSPLSRRSIGRTTPKARLRHDDSQIQFAAIDSSPLNPGVAESQNLTDRQKEVKERQGVEAAMFPEIRSSPKSASKHPETSLPKLVLKANQVSALRNTADELISPVYPPDETMSGFLGSSPTPASTKKRSETTRADDGPPSSPPSLPSDLKTKPMTSSDDVADLLPEPVVADLGIGSNDLASKHTTGLLIDPNVDKGRVPSSVSNNDFQSQSHVSESLAQVISTDDRTMSDPEVYVDAPSVPTEQEPITMDTEEINTVVDSFSNENVSHFRSEEEEVTAQLVNEMERASQQSISPNKSMEPASEVSKKRKGAFDSPVGSRKKVRDSTSPQPVSEASRNRSSIAECVLINVRPFDNNTVEAPIQIKTEGSQSPSLVGMTPSETEVPAAKKRIRRRSRASQHSQGGSSVSETSQQRTETSESNDKLATTADETPTNARKSARLNGTLRSSPQRSIAPSLDNKVADPKSVTKRGKIRAGKRWFWSRKDPQESEGESDNGGQVTRGQEEASGLQESEHSQQLPGTPDWAGQKAKDHDCPSSTNEPAGKEEELAMERRGVPALKEGLKQLLDRIKQSRLRPEEEREMVGILFESVKEVHEAGRRNAAV